MRAYSSPLLKSCPFFIVEGDASVYEDLFWRFASRFLGVSLDAYLDNLSGSLTAHVKQTDFSSIPRAYGTSEDQTVPGIKEHLRAATCSARVLVCGNLL